uniref:Zinc finger protein n=1 Tax=Pararge aegeria TaxID=116150 RepID=S4NXX7_9NEOP
MSETKESDGMEEICRGVAELSVLSFRKLDEVKRLANHFRYVMNHPITQQNKVVLRYMKNLDDTHRKIFLQERELVEVEFIFTTEKKSNLQRQRFNSLPVSEVPELLKSELLTSENAKQVHICTDCNVEIELNDEEPLMESLQKHFSLEVHMPKLKRVSIDVAEPVVLPKMSRRLSAMESGESAGNLDQIIQLVRPMEKLDKMFIGKLETCLIKHLPDNSEASIDAAIRFYQQSYHKLCQEISAVDFSALTSSVAPIIMSIKDNVNQNFSVDANKNFENDESEQSVDRPIKSQVKKFRYYGPIENLIVKLLTNHKLLTLVDDRTGKLAFFCMSCEYYTLRFRYDSVLNHVFSESHIHNLSCILQSDKHIPFTEEASPMQKIKEMNHKFLLNHGITERNGIDCNLCKSFIESSDNIIMHILDENHLGRLSDKLYRKMKANNPDGLVPDEWGPKSLDWARFLASVGKPLNSRDHVVIENFVRPSSKIANYCSCCDMTLKGPRQVLFNHIRQKKHLRNAAPHKLSLLYKNYCRPAEYFASFGNFYVCSLCPSYIALPSFAAIVDHFDSPQHIESVSKLIRTALYPDTDTKLLESSKITISDEIKCVICEESFTEIAEAVKHVLTNINHQNSIVESKTKANKGDVISVYMKGNYVLHNDGATFKCVPCDSVFNSIRALLAHLVYAEHFDYKPSAENVFRFYLEMKHNVNMLARNKYDYYQFGVLKCGVCDADLEEGENAKRHVVSARHRENMGASYVNVSLDASAVE